MIPVYSDRCADKFFIMVLPVEDLAMQTSAEASPFLHQDRSRKNRHRVSERSLNPPEI